ncbi:MAG: hypothetical protein ACJA13_003727, partial [Paraglaciecola sp.]
CALASAALASSYWPFHLSSYCFSLYLMIIIQKIILA